VLNALLMKKHTSSAQSAVSELILHGVRSKMLHFNEIAQSIGFMPALHYYQNCINGLICGGAAI